MYSEHPKPKINMRTGPRKISPRANPRPQPRDLAFRALTAAGAAPAAAAMMGNTEPRAVPAPTVSRIVVFQAALYRVYVL